MAIGAPTLLFTVGAATGTTLGGTVAANCPVGQPILVSVDSNVNPATTLTCSDSQSNTYTQITNITSTTVFIAVPTSGKNLVSSTDTITVDFHATITRGSVLAVVGQGYTGTPTVDVSVTGNNTSSASLPTADLVTTQAAALLWANESYTTSGTTALLTAATNWTLLSSGTESAPSGVRCRTGGHYRVVSSTSTYTSSTGGAWQFTNNSNRAVAVAVYDVPATAASASISDRRTRRRVIYR